MNHPGKFAAVALLLAAAACTPDAVPATQTLCGVRSGNDGNASLLTLGGGTVIRLATKGGDQHLLQQADSLVAPNRDGDVGTQLGVKYCLTVRMDSDGNPVAIERAWHPTD